MNVVTRLSHICLTGFGLEMLVVLLTYCRVFLVFCNTIFPFRYLIRVAKYFLYSFATGSACEEVVGLDVHGGSEFITNFLSLGGQQILVDFHLPCCSKVITFLHNRV
jgi:hypothetical protein